ncbi:DUF6508 domain-containing protein [Paenibacillus jamilae]
MSDIHILARTEIERLLVFIDCLQDDDHEHIRIVNGYPCESEVVTAFRKVLDDIGFLIVFDWKAWLAEHETYQDIRNNIDEQIRNADIDTLRKLMTCYIRGDRFNEGMFAAVIQNGNVSIILRRLRELFPEE